MGMDLTRRTAGENRRRKPDEIWNRLRLVILNCSAIQQLFLLKRNSCTIPPGKRSPQIFLPGLGLRLPAIAMRQHVLNGFDDRLLPILATASSRLYIVFGWPILGHGCPRR